MYYKFIFLWILYVIILLYFEFLSGIVISVVVVVWIMEFYFGDYVGVFSVFGVGVN